MTISKGASSSLSRKCLSKAFSQTLHYAVQVIEEETESYSSISYVTYGTLNPVTLNP